MPFTPAPIATPIPKLNGDKARVHTEVIQLLDVEQLRHNGAPARSPKQENPSRAVIIQLLLDLKRAPATATSLGGGVVELEPALVQPIMEVDRGTL